MVSVKLEVENATLWELFFTMQSVKMIWHSEISAGDVRSKIRQQKITFGGNTRLNIYGTLNCKSGKKIKVQNRIFFSSEKEALSKGFRPCGHCMKQKYQKWKN